MFKAEKNFKILQIFIIGFNGLIIFCGWINIFSKRLLSVPQYYGEPGYHTYEVASTVEVIDNFAFNYSIRISKVVLPAGLKTIGAGLFVNSAVNEIEFLGTVSEWENVSKGGIVEGTETEWNLLCNVREVKCSDATYEIPQEPVVEEEVA